MMTDDFACPRNLVRMAWHYRRHLAKGAILGVARNAALAPLPIFFQLIIDEHLQSGNLTGVLSVTLMFVGLLAIHYTLTMEGAHALGTGVSSLIRELRGRVFAKLQFLHFGYLDNQKTGRLVSKYAFDTQNVEMALMPMLHMFVPGMAYSGMLLALLAALDWRLSLILLVMLPLYAFARYTMFGHIEKTNHATRLAREKLTGTASELIGAIRLIRGYGQEGKATGALEASSETFARSRVDQIIANNYLGTFGTLAGNLISLVIVAGGAILVLHESLTLGTLFAFVAALPILMQPIWMFTQMSQQYFQGEEAYKSIRELLEARYVEAWHGRETLPRFHGEIIFRDVCFHYGETDRAAVEQINLRIAPGEHVAFVGPSGSGKSTLANLILGLYDPSSGAITIDSIPQAELDMRWLRRQCAIVMQESILLSDTIYENLRFANPAASEEEIYDAARRANADGFIHDLPEGYQTKVGERGASLSGGQRQRISIARAILRDPRILILDEATSALDYESERLIQDALDKLSAGRTVITIAHRLSTVKKADRIVVLNRGRLVESGSYDELSRREGYFRDLLLAQA